MEKSDSYKYYNFDEENSILTHDVSIENIHDDESHLISMSYFTTIIHKCRPKNIIVRIFAEPHNYDNKHREFIKNVVYKAILDVGVKKIAFYFSKKKFLDLVNHQEFEGSFQAKVFLDLQQAKEWIMQNDN